LPHFKRGRGIKMDVQAISQLISTVGFPIAVVVWLFYYQKTVLDQFRDQMTENTKVMQSLVMEIHEHIAKGE
jgi:hypothetical protein